ncbi:MAG: NAD(P)H-hydrate dehydratase [Lentimicrobium sp.]|jgi:NAD(P)H-hydrate epimerase|nr:NAD(P)H-hydrate dehydratase [Lentimicrobium sp.]MDD2528605.1 NAD(P)H-hydrate dehydratase [Lentimicrobiaceae bacterium]MDD4598324.1 NAD(P)H-hydrate dehydratase [Lentimicrobiaceae bacterium]MDY0026839.1 NAD(P)H-hydrate dehydratase [Lentimicrobium sp.]
MCALKILPVEKIREADAYTIQNEPIDSINLMERAAKACFRWMTKRLKKSSRIKIVCGTGNNGGDGLALARMLFEADYDTEVTIINHTGTGSADFEENFNFLAELPGLIITNVTEHDPQIDFKGFNVVVDAIFGSGLNRAPEGLYAEAINQINACQALIIAIDMPSGLFADKPTSAGATIVHADYTLTFQLPKLAFVLPGSEMAAGEWQILDIGLHQDFIQACETRHSVVEAIDCVQLYRPRSRFVHKGNFGHALLLAGSTGKYGAAIMAALACLRSGVGLLTAHLPINGFDIMQTAVPEAMVSIDNEDNYLSVLPDLAPYSVIAAGPGLGMEAETQSMLKLLIQQTRVPLILDADALNILSENKTWISFLPEGTILTPHPGEFDRLAGKASDPFARLELLQAFATRYNLNVVLKGAYTATATPLGNVYFNSTGNPGMATGGSGDVLTGIITGLLASGYTAGEACVLGVWLHGKAGDMAAKTLGHEALLPTDIIRYLGKAFRKISK